MNFDIEQNDMNNAMRMRNSQLHPPEYEYGLDDSTFDENAMDTNFNGFGLDNDMGLNDDLDTSSNMFGTGANAGMPNSMMDLSNDPMQFTGSLPSYTPMGGNINTETKDLDAQIVDHTIKAAKESWTFLKECVAAFKDTTYYTCMSTGKESVIISIIMLVLGIILGCFKIKIGWQIAVGAAIAGVVGVVLFWLGYKRQQKTSNTSQTGVIQTEMDTNETLLDDAEDDAEDDAVEDTFDVNAMPTDMLSSTDVMANTFTDDFTDNEFENSDYAYEDDFEEDIESTIDTDAIINSINVENGVVTRQYLYEHFMPMLRNCNADYAVEEILSEDSKEFAKWVTVVQYAVEALMPNNEDAPVPQLLQVKQKLFYVVLEIQRVSWLKNIDKFVEEIVNTASYDTETNTKIEGIYATGTTAGKTIYIKVMTGKTTTVAIKDIYTVERNYMLDTKHTMPVAVGINIDGKAVMADLKTVDSMLVAGAPRSGKSWFVKTMIAQMMMFNSPDDLNFYFCDPKDKVSDFVDIETPHVKKFVTTDDAIIAVVKELAHTEGLRRQELFSAAGVHTIWDYRQKCPNEKMPLIYLVIDEITTITSRMSADDRRDFEKSLKEFITKLACYGIRLWIIPHMVKNTILSKDVTDMVAWRACVRFTQTNVCNVLDIDKKSWPYKLANQGDMAVRNEMQQVSYVHGTVAATTDDEYKALFTQISGVWQKINPKYIVDIEKVHTSMQKRDGKVVHTQKQDIKNNTKTAKHVSLMDIDDDDVDDIEIW